jgi:hypothetical protein
VDRAATRERAFGLPFAFLRAIESAFAHLHMRTARTRGTHTHTHIHTHTHTHTRTHRYILELEPTPTPAKPTSSSSSLLDSRSSAAASSNTATLSVVETNAFKNLVHLSLRLIPGTDATVKKHLAGCLVACKAECARLRDSLSTTETKLTSELAAARDESAAAAASVTALRTELTNVTSRLTSEHATELARLRDEATSARAAADEQSRRASRMADEAAAAAVGELRAKLTETMASDAAKAAQLLEVEGALRDARARLASAEGSAATALADLDQARSEVRALRTKGHEADCTLTENRVRIAELTEQVLMLPLPLTCHPSFFLYVLCANSAPLVVSQWPFFHTNTLILIVIVCFSNLCLCAHTTFSSHLSPSSTCPHAPWVGPWKNGARAAAGAPHRRCQRAQKAGRGIC